MSDDPLLVVAADLDAGRGRDGSRIVARFLCRIYSQNYDQDLRLRLIHLSLLDCARLDGHPGASQLPRRAEVKL